MKCIHVWIVHSKINNMYLKIDHFTLTLICKIPVKYYTTHNLHKSCRHYGKKKKKSGSAATRHSYKALQMMQQSLPTLEDFAIKNSILNDYKRIIALRTIVSDLITPFTVFPGIVVHSLIEEFKSFFLFKDTPFASNQSLQFWDSSQSWLIWFLA